MTTAHGTGELGALLRLFASAGRLKTTARTGWLDRGVAPVATESVADHTFRVALMAWLTAGPELDRDRVLKLALLHDLAEAETGDLTPYAPAEIPEGEDRDAFLNQRHIPDAARAAAKRKAEADAFARMIAGLPAGLAAELAELWREWEARQSPEARFVKQIDRLETFLQSREYAAIQPDLAVNSFAVEAVHGIDDSMLSTLRELIATDYDDAVGTGEALVGTSASSKLNLMSSKSPLDRVPST